VNQSELDAQTSTQCQAQENMQPVSSAGKHAAGVENRKTCSRYQARENMQRVSGAGKNAASAKLID